ncbi:hypothetical protein BAUCODRAFT_453808 [Baudoinia panamericana UAMH 10762]|uniref:Uncharacterized protein n=1 Tax=Baudoinia panamericana (strain UAMH 10762) TaxID=717646 RepID=M2N0Q7_BAUPA|nr:uncharacterized protein BAUCODRAFT_453808 [Baudoinia panamericana UAMH 10762]EMC97498.1 hypothetical protein BAUCODRAFT_453808 [Baudoinia panamericana UAMH 10762]
MVHLSLQHRVKYKRQASFYGETFNTAWRRTLLGLSVTAAILNVMFLLAGIFMVVLTGYSWEINDRWHKSGDVEVDRIGTAFFWLTIPLLLAVLSIADSIIQRRAGAPRAGLSAICAVIGLLGWGTQFGMESTCLFTLSYKDGQYTVGADFCPWTFKKGWHPGTYFHSALGVGYYFAWSAICMLVIYFVHIILAAIVLFQQRKVSAAPFTRKRAYSYHSPVDGKEMLTNRDMPDRSAATTPRPYDADHELKEPLSYHRPASMSHDDLADDEEKKRLVA